MAYAPPSIGESGLKIPTFSEILNYLIGQFRAIFGNAAYLAPDAADYQDLAVRALQAENFAQSIQALYLAFNPQTAIGRSLDLIGKLIGTPRKAASYSTAMVTLSGDPGTTVTSGVVRDVNGRYWDLASPASIGTSGTVSVLATAKIIGDVTANPGEIRTISTPTAGWTGATNPADAIPGEAVEPDSQYRARLLVAQMKPSRSLVAGTAQAIGEVLGVTRWKVYENPNGFSCGFGAVTTDGTDVALLYGYPFDATNVEQTITINGVAYTIDSVTGPDALVLTGTAGTQTGVAYSIGGGDQVGPPHSITCVVEGGVAADIAQAIYANSGIGCYRNGTTTVTVIDPDNHNAASPIRFFILAYVPVYVALDVHPLPGFTTATEAAIAAGIVSYLNSLGIGESVVFSELYGAALTARPNPDEPLFSIRAGLSGYQAASVAGDTAIGSPDVTVVSADGIVSGQVVVGTGIPDNTTVSTVVGTTVTLSANATADGSDVPLAFFTPGTTDLAVLYGQAAQGSLTYVVINLV
jgi:Uncharacterized homolog of phage Mu protein gp47